MPHEDFLLRELLDIAEAKSRADWDHTASIVATLAEINRDPARRATPFRPDDFNPWRARKPKRLHTDKDFDVLVNLFVPKEDREHKPTLFERIFEEG